MTSPIGTIDRAVGIGYDDNLLGTAVVQTVTATSPLTSSGGENPDIAFLASYGETYYFNETGSVLTLTTQNTAYRWITGIAGTVKGAGFVTWNDAAAPTGKRLTIGASGAGVYLVAATFAGNLQKHADLSMDVYLNTSAAQNITCDFHVTEDGAYVSGAASGLLTLAAGDTVTMWFAASIGANAFTIKHANLTLQRIDV